MVVGSLEMGDLDLCEGCIFGKQSRKSFSVGKSWRVARCLVLVHADLCGLMKIESHLVGIGIFFYLLITIAI